MQYNGHATQQDCISEILKITKATLGKYPLVDITRRFNFSLDRYFSLAFQANGQWSFDDINQTNPPIDTQNIVSGTNKYKISAFTEKIFQITKLELLDSTGHGVTFEPETFEDLDRLGTTFEEAYRTTLTGVPNKYLKLGDYIYIRNCPNYSYSAGLKAYFDRPASYMVSTDTTKVPGVPVMHHQYLCRLAAQPYLDENTMSNAVANQASIIKDEMAITSYFTRREKPLANGLRTKQQNNR